LLNVTEWNVSVLCFYSCGNERKVVTTNLTVYRPLEPAVLDLVPELAVGESHQLTCRVPNVAPIKKLVVILKEGDETLKKENFEKNNHVEPRVVEVQHLLTARRQDNG
ncbi:ICAM2 protein, partial [Geococcyx californianus]|nr:ICAM2 protein [Geococcyx californianus]